MKKDKFYDAVNAQLQENNDKTTPPIEVKEGQHTPGPWAWQKFGNYYMLAAQHGMREIILGSLAVEMPQETYAAMNNDGRLQPIDPKHPNAELIASAPQLKADNIKLQEANRELLEALNKCSPLLDELINKTPTGFKRNGFTDINIQTKATIEKHNK